MLPKSFLQNAFFVVAIGGLAYVSMTLYNENNALTSEKSPFPLFEIKGYDLVRFDAKGDRIYTIKGPELEHYDDDRGSTLQHPFLTHFTDQGGIDWTASSNEAIVNEDHSLITMNEDVVLTKYNAENAKTTVLNTSQLYVHNKGEKVTNNVWTKIRSYPNNTIEGIGLIGYPNLGQFNLLKDVHSYYETIQDENTQ